MAKHKCPDKSRERHMRRKRKQADSDKCDQDTTRKTIRTSEGSGDHDGVEESPNEPEFKPDFHKFIMRVFRSR
jgi:hypothetical protein